MAVDPAGSRTASRRAMRRSRRMPSEATGRVAVVAHRLAATPKLPDEIARARPPLSAAWPCWCGADSVPKTGAVATFTPALPLLEPVAAARVGGLGQGPPSG
jgi:hypothetical protein